METYHKIQTLFKRDLDGSRTGQKGKMIEGEWTTPELEYLVNNEWEFTEKVDGTNIRIGLTRHDDIIDVEFGGRTDRASIPAPLGNWLNKMFPSSHPARRAASGRDAIVGRWMIDNDLTEVVLFGEGYGIDIQNGGNYIQKPAEPDENWSKQKFVLFDVKVGPWWLDRNAVNEVAKTLQIESVPVIGAGSLYAGIELVASRGSSYQMKSQWGDFEAEGIVARPKVPLFNRKGERIICKIKAVDFR